MSEYSEKLKDPRWQKKRLEVFERDDFRCQLCWCNTKTLHVHHKYYTKGKDPWQYQLKAFLTLCSDCHGKIHPRKPFKMPKQLTKEELDKQWEDSEEARKKFFDTVYKALQ